MSTQKPVALPHAVALNHPIERRENNKVVGTIDTVTIMRWPVLDDLIKMENRSQLAQHQYAIGALTDLPAPAVAKLRADDFRRLAGLLGPFFEAGEDEGSTPASDDSDD